MTGEAAAYNAASHSEVQVGVPETPILTQLPTNASKTAEDDLKYSGPSGQIPVLSS